MSCKTHIVNVGLLRTGIRQPDRIITETEAFGRAVALGNGKERFTVIALNPCNKIIFTVQIKSSGIEDRVNSQSFHKKRIVTEIKIILPERRYMLPCQHRFFISAKHPVVKIRFFVFFRHCILIIGKNLFHAFVEHNPYPRAFGIFQ